MTITLTGEIEKGLLEQAEKTGDSPEALAIETLRRRFAPPAAREAAATEGGLVDFLGEFVGCVSSEESGPTGARTAADVGRRFAEGMLEKQRQGRL